MLLLRLMMYACYLSSWETEGGRLRVQDQPGLPSEFKTSLGYMCKTQNQKATRKCHKMLLTHNTHTPLRN